MYKFKNREIHNTLTGELTVVHVRTFNNFLTSEFGPSTRGERDNNSLKPFVSYYANKTQTLGTSRGVLDLLSSSLVGTRKTLPYASTVETPNSQHHGLNSTSTLDMAQVTSQLDRSPFDNQLDWSLVNYQRDSPTVEYPTDVFLKSPNYQPIASGHDVIHTPASFPILGLLWQLWLSYPLCPRVNCTQYLCTWTKSQIVQSPTKLNDKI